MFAFGLPPILGLGTAGGFEFMLEDRAGGDIAQLADAAATGRCGAASGRSSANVASTVFRDRGAAVQGRSRYRQGRRRLAFR